MADLTVSANVDTFMGAANYAAMRTQLSLVIGTNVQAFNANLTALAALTYTQNSFPSRVGIGSGVPDQIITIGSDFSLSGNTLALANAYQPIDADLTSWAAITRASGFDTFTATPSGANLASLLTSALPATKGGTGLTSLGTGVATFLGTPSSANLLAAITDPNGTGLLIFSTSPSLVTPDIGAATGTSVSLTGPSTIGGTISSSTQLALPAGTTGVSPLRLAHGVAPTSPVNGDTWTTTAGLYVRINGATVGPLAASSGTTLTATYVAYGDGSNAITGEAAFTYAASTNTLTVDNIAASGTVTAGAATVTTIAPAADATTPLGDATHGWTRLYMGTGGIISFGSTNWVATHTSGILTVGTGDLRITTAGTNSASVVTVGGTQSLTNKKLGSLTTNGLVTTSSSDGTLSVTVPGTGVLTALAVNVGSAGAFVTFNGNAGTPSAIVLTNASGTVTNLTLVTPILGAPQSGNLSNCTADGTNAVGYRNVPQNAKTGSYTLLATDVGKVVPNTTGGWTVNNSVHTAGDVITVYNDSASSQNITAGTITTMRLAGTATTGTRALAGRGLATLYFQTATEVIVSGAGVT